MKIAVTADLHLTSRVRNPERYHALANILEQLADRKIDNLVIAGDLFDASCNDPGSSRPSSRIRNMPGCPCTSSPATTMRPSQKGLLPCPIFITSPVPAWFD